MTTLAVPRSPRTSATAVYHVPVDDVPYHCRHRRKIQGYGSERGVSMARDRERWRIKGRTPRAHGFSRKLQADRERGRIAVSHCRWSQHELITTTAEDPILLVSRCALSFRGIRRVSVDAIR